MDVLGYHDSVIDNDTNGKNKREQGHGTERKVEHMHYGHGTNTR